jgi:hypothetical protein
VRTSQDCKIVEKIDRDEEHCLVVAGPAMSEGDFSISFRCSVHIEGTQFGLVKEHAEWHKDQFSGNSTLGWSMRANYGDLYGNGKHGSDDAGKICLGDIVTLQVDLVAQTLQFYKTGTQHGPGYTNIVGPVRWGCYMGRKDTVIEIVEDPRLQ